MLLIDGIIGARPNMMKMAPLARALAADGTFKLRLIHTGQHYDEQMSDIFLRELGLPAPDFNLGVGSGSQGAQTAHIIEAYEKLLLAGERPRGVIVVGDVNSTMACALAAAKLGMPIAHVEAGLRSGDRTMPEEINRIVTDTLSDLLFVSEPSGLINLAREGVDPRKIHFVGNIMIDTLVAELPKAEKSAILDELVLNGSPYAYLTLHRPSNVDDPETLRRLMATVDELSQEMPFVFSVHPRTQTRLKDASIQPFPPQRVRMVGPLSYHDSLKLIRRARVVLTDSGGIQEETSFLNVPCLTLRNTTERPVTVELGTSQLVGNEPEAIRNGWHRAINGPKEAGMRIPLWDGQTAQRVCDCIRAVWGQDAKSRGRSHAYPCPSLSIRG
jgi:UDP-N-acetylglucosamine 2-epimerase (non-hydrolysing)